MPRPPVDAKGRYGEDEAGEQPTPTTDGIMTAEKAAALIPKEIAGGKQYPSQRRR